MKENPIIKLESFGQSVWLDFIQRGLLTSGELKRMIEEDGLRGVTTNPAIFEKEIGKGHDYDGSIRALARQGKSAEEIYEAIITEDVQRASDILLPVFKNTAGRDGFVSLEVSPHLARDTENTIEQALRFWKAVSRPNVMIKVPATAEGLPAIEELLREGVNVNITLLFSIPRYQDVAEAYISVLEERLSKKNALDSVSSVASFFLSRIDVMVDPMIDKIVKEGGPRARKAAGLRGQAATASAKVAYQFYKELFTSTRFLKLAASGARTQRLLWASTGTKDPSYSDVKYIEPLIGPDTVNTMPLETFTAYLDHGNPAERLDKDVEEAQRILDTLPEAGIGLDDVTRRLEEEGIRKFAEPFDRLINTIRERRIVPAA